MRNKKSMPERLRERLQTQKYYMTTDLHIIRFLEEKGIKPYNTDEHKQHKGIIMYFYGNSSKLRACLYEWYETR